MIGLEYIRRTFGDTAVTLAEKLGISRVNISKWENGKKAIPEKRLEELSALYNVCKDVFSRELTVLEQLYIKRAALLNRCNNGTAYNIRRELSDLDNEIEIEKILQEVKQIIVNTRDNSTRLNFIKEILGRISD